MDKAANFIEKRRHMRLTHSMLTRGMHAIVRERLLTCSTDVQIIGLRVHAQTILMQGLFDAPIFKCIAKTAKKRRLLQPDETV